jgi:SAM-dependent methyltransferase
MSGIEQHHADWEQLAELDPQWAILSSPERRFGGWEDDEFFATGELEVDALLARIEETGGTAGRHAALDFGCGVGRISRALAGHYDEVVGVDISETMLARGRELNAGIANIEFVHNSAPDLRALGERSFDLVYSTIVLQHQPTRSAARGYVQEMVRLLRPGGRLVFQIPLDIPLRHRLQPVRRAYATLRSLGVSPRTLYERLHLHPIRMQFVPEEELRRWLSDVRVDAIDRRRVGPVLSGTVYATRPAGQAHPPAPSH